MTQEPSTKFSRLLLLLFCSSAAAEAQFQQYQAPGQFGGRTESMQETLETAIKNARWRLGRLYLHPWAGLVDLSYIDNVAGQQVGAETSDITATAGVGVRTYLPMGSELVFAAHALPEYVWWQDLSGRSRVNGRYGMGLFGNIRGVGLELSARREEQSSYFSRELEDRVNSKDEIIDLLLDAPLAGGASFFVTGSLRDVSFSEDDTAIRYSLLDRQETVGRAGLRYRTQGGLLLGIGVESSEADFEDSGGQVSNSGIAPILELLYDSPTFFFEADLASRDLEASGDSLFAPYDGITGTVQTAWRPIPPVEFQLFSRRDLVYSLSEDTSHFEDSSFGFGTQFSLGRTVGLRLYAEEGTLDFTALEAETTRADDFDSLGAELQLEFGRINIFLGTSRTEYDSSLPGLDRTVTVTTAGISLGGRSTSAWG